MGAFSICSASFLSSFLAPRYLDSYFFDSFLPLRDEVHGFDGGQGVDVRPGDLAQDEALVVGKEAELPGHRALFALLGTGQRGHADLVEFPLLEVFQYFLGAPDDLVGHAGKPRHLDAVAAVRRALHDLAQKDDPLAPLLDGDVIVCNAFARELEVRELVIVSGKEGPRPELCCVVDVLGHGPGNAQAVEGARPPSHLVQQDEAPGGSVPEDVGDLRHLHHEGALALGQDVAGAHAGKYPVHKADARLGGRHEAPHLGQDDDVGDLADKGGFARHVGPRDDQKAVGAAVQVHIVGNEALGKGHPLHHGVSAVADLDGVAVVDGGSAVVVLLGHLGKTGRRVEIGQGGGALLDAPDLAGDALADLDEQLVLPLPPLLLGVEHRLLVLLELLVDVALGVHEGLLADVLGGDGRCPGFRHLDVVAEDAVEAHAQTCDARALPLLLLEGGDPGLPVARYGQDPV